MRLRHIELFQAILQTGSLTAAAELLHISQPAASKALQHAEQQLGFALFDRVRGKLQPTAEARILQQKTEALAAELQSLRRLAGNLRRGEEHALRLVCTPTLAQELVPQALRQWREVFADIPCELATQHTAEMVQSLLLREADIGLTLQQVEHPGLHSECLASGHMQVIAPPAWWSAAQSSERLHLQSLADAPLIGLDTRDALGGLLREHLQALQPAPRINTWVQTYQLAGTLVAAGQGLALVDPLTARAAASGSGVQVRALEPALAVPLFRLSRVGEEPSHAQQALLKQVQALARQIMPG